MYHAANSLNRSSARVSRPFSEPVALSGAIIFSAVFLADTFPFAPFLMTLKVVLDTFRSDLNVFRAVRLAMTIQAYLVRQLFARFARALAVARSFRPGRQTNSA